MQQRSDRTFTIDRKGATEVINSDRVTNAPRPHNAPAFVPKPGQLNKVADGPEYTVQKILKPGQRTTSSSSSSNGLTTKTQAGLNVITFQRSSCADTSGDATAARQGQHAQRSHVAPLLTGDDAA